LRKLINEIVSLLSLNGGSNIKVALLCIVMATLFWFFNALNKDYSANVNYPIVFVYDTENYQELQELPDEVLLNMSGVGWNLLRKSLGFKVEPLSLRLENPDLTKRIPGSSLPGVITDQVADLQLNYVLTDTLYLNMDRRVKRTIPIDVDRESIRFRDNYLLVGEISTSPATIELTGPESILNNLGDTLYISITDNNIDEDFSEVITIDINEEDLIQRNPPTAEVSFNVEESVISTINIRLKEVKFPSNAYLKDTIVDISIRGRSSIITTLEPEDFDVIADYSTMLPGDSSILPLIRRYPSSISELIQDSIRVKVGYRD